MRLLLAAFLLGLALLVSAGGYVIWLPDVASLKRTPPKTTAYMELRKNEAAAKGRKLELRWTWVPSDAISENLKSAVVTAEDDTFYRHDGVAWEALRAAFRRDRKEGKLSVGGSTIDMQLARNLYLSPSKNPLRKIKEILIARRLDRTLGKRRVLELYLNVVEWGKGIFGCEAAAQAYFGKPCSKLSPDEAVAMAVVLPNPRRWDPSKPGKYVARNSARIVRRMAASGLWPEPQESEEDSVSPAEAASEAWSPEAFSPRVAPPPNAAAGLDSDKQAF